MTTTKLLILSIIDIIYSDFYFYKPMNKFNLTTAISYVNGPPHIGHVLEFIIADVISRYRRTNGTNVKFSTGTDEHGQKIQTKAESLNISPMELCNINSKKFKEIHDLYDIDYDQFVRTTDKRHKKTVYNFYELCKEDIYLGEYTGWYNPREERFVPEIEAALSVYTDLTTGDKLVYTKEPSYFFRLNKYRERIIDYIENHPNFILPISKRTEILEKLEEELTDLSISRTSINWGIPVPGNSSHVFYVWFEALINYITGQVWEDPTSPCDLHVIGKDILWFHSVIWLGMLFSSGYKPPRQIYVHDFINDKSGKKMSKTLCNIVDPVYLINKYPVCAIRYYIISNLNYGSDSKFSEKALVRCHDSELLEIYGNYVNRVFGLIYRYCDGFILPADKPIEIFDIGIVNKKLEGLISEIKLQDYIKYVMNVVKSLNKYINDTEVWTIQNKKYPQDNRPLERRNVIVKALAEGLYIVTHYLYPVIPTSCEKVWGYLGVSKNEYGKLNWNNLWCMKIKKQKTLLFQTLDKESYIRRKDRNKHPRL
jgi:methionyl-tRNA synthetase